MAQLDRSGLCELAEYWQVFHERLQADDLTDAEILTLYLRLEKVEMAVKLPVQVKVKGRHVAGLAVDICLMDEDLKALHDTTCSGIMTDGVWDAPDKKDGFFCPDQHDRPVYAYNGVFMQYDDGIDMSLFEGELTGVGASTGLNLGSTRL